MTVQHKSRRRPEKQGSPLLIIGTLGTIGVIALYFIVGDFQPIELLLMLIVVGFCAAGYTRGIIRGIMTFVMLYFATGIAATFYRMATPYIGGIQQALLFNVNATPGDIVNRSTLALSFSVLTAIIWGVLEIIGRVSFRDTTLPGIGILDKLGGVALHLAIGILVAALLFNAFGYGRSRPIHNAALLRPTLNQVLYVYYTTQSFWFPWTPPPIYAYDLDLQRVR